MRESFLVPTRLQLSLKDGDAIESILPGGFFGGICPASTANPFILYSLEIPTFLLSVSNLVELDKICAVGFISPAANVTALVFRVEILFIRFQSAIMAPVTGKLVRLSFPGPRIALPVVQ